MDFLIDFISLTIAQDMLIVVSCIGTILPGQPLTFMSMTRSMVFIYGLSSIHWMTKLMMKPLKVK